MIKLYIYDIKSGMYLWETSGHIESVLTMSSANDFTLAEPPSHIDPWYWHNNAWQAEPKPTP